MHLAGIALQQRLRHRILVGREIVKERIPQRRLAEPPLDALPVLTAFRISLERGPPLFAEYELDLAKLMRLKAAARLQPVTKRQEVERRDRLEHIDLRDQGLENRQNA